MSLCALIKNQFQRIFSNLLHMNKVFRFGDAIIPCTSYVRSKKPFQAHAIRLPWWRLIFSILLSHPVWLYGCYLSWKPVWLFEIIVNHFLTDSLICNTITIINDKWEQPSDWTLKAILWYPEVINTVAWAVAILFSFKFTVMLTGIIYRKCGYRFEIFAGANTIISFN